MTDHLPVLCCCDPDNLEGYAPAGLDIPVREYDDPSGGGLAYVAHGIDLESIDGFVRANKRGGKKGGKPKPPVKRTWRK